MIVKPSPLTRALFSSLHSTWLTAAGETDKLLLKPMQLKKRAVISILLKNNPSSKLCSRSCHSLLEKPDGRGNPFWDHSGGRWCWTSKYWWKRMISLSGKVTLAMQWKGNSKPRKQSEVVSYPQQVMHWSGVPAWKQMLAHILSSVLSVRINYKYCQLKILLSQIWLLSRFYIPLKTYDKDHTCLWNEVISKRPPTWQPGAGLPFSWRCVPVRSEW